MNNLVSIIIPIYNVEDYIDRCLNSIINQSYKNIEIILVDDGSKDNCPKICDEYKKKYNNIKVVHKNNAGLGMARNSGLDVAVGQYVMFIDGDDFISTDYVEKLVSAIIETKSDVVLCGHNRVFKNGTMEIHEHIYSGKTFENQEIINFIIPKLCGKKPDNTDNIEMSVCMGIFNNKIIKDNKIKFVSEREYISEDFVFDLDLYSKVKRVSFINLVGYYYCDNEGSLTTKYRPDRFERQVCLSKFVESKLKTLGIYSLCEQRLYNTLISIARYAIKLEQKFSKKNGLKKSIKNIKKICSNDYLKEAFSKYDTTGIAKKNAIVNFFIRHKKVYILWVIMFIKNSFNI